MVLWDTLREVLGEWRDGWRERLRRPKVPAQVTHNLKVSAQAQAIAEGMKYGDPNVNLEVLVAAAKLLDVEAKLEQRYALTSSANGYPALSS